MLHSSSSACLACLLQGEAELVDVWDSSDLRRRVLPSKSCMLDGIATCSPAQKPANHMGGLGESDAVVGTSHVLCAFAGTPQELRMFPSSGE